MTQENRNFFLAIALSILVIVGWQYFFAQPQFEKTRQTQAELAKPAALPGSPDAVPSPSPAAPPQGGVTPSTPAAPAVLLTRAEALAASPRIKLDTKNLSGSIALKGARIDDVSLKAYRETTDPNSPIITLLSPSGGPSPFYAELGFVGGNLPLPKYDTLWTADGDVLTEAKPLTLTYDDGHGLIFHRKIAVDDRYMFTVTDSVENKTAEPVTLNSYGLVSRHGKPQTSGYAVLHEGMVGIIGDASEQEITYDGIEKETRAQKVLSGIGGWLGFTDKYWAAVVIPDQQKPFDARFSASGTSFKTYQTDVLGPAETITPGASTTVTTRVFAGAKEVQTLNDYMKDPGIKKFNLLIDWGYLWMITQPMFSALDWIYRIVGNFGVAILILTVLVKVAFFPLANRSYLSMAKMKAMQPQMVAIRERYADDKMKQQQETMELYKREKINPVAGCLPMLIQIPVFFALYKVLFITIEMRQAPFFGWIKDLSQPDPTNVFNLFGLLPYDPTALPLVGHFLAIGIWPLIMGVSMFVQMKMNPEPPDPVQRQMFTWMPVIFTFMLGTFPSGLVIYWTWNNTLSVTQQTFIMRKAGVKVELWDNLMAMFRKKKVILE